MNHDVMECLSVTMRGILVAASLGFLAACGGGGGSNSQPTQNAQAQTNQASTSTTNTAGQNQASGCSTTVVSDAISSVHWPGTNWTSAEPQSQGLCPDEISDALDYAFALGNDTGAVLIIKNGYLVEERYSANKQKSDLVTSWSVAKSFTSALVGRAIDEGYIKGLDQPLGDFLSSWSESPKGSITLHHLLTVRTALELLNDDDEDGVPDGGPLYNSADQLALSLDRPLIGEPGEKLYVYSNSDVMIAGEVVRQATGASVRDYLQLGLGQRIGFEGEWWTDTSDQVMSYCCLDATPRNFARFGLLFARDGKWNAEQLLSNAWINESTLPAKGGNYGFYWWPIGNGGFAALGVQGQLIAIYPDEDLVILRFGNYERMGDGSTVKEGANYHRTSEPANFEVSEFLRLVREALPETTAIGGPSGVVPVADAGKDQVALSNSQITLSGGNSSHSLGDPLTYDWELVSKPANSTAIITGIGEIVSFVGDQTGDYKINLTVSNGRVSSTTQAITVTVVNDRNLLLSGTSAGMWPSYSGNLSSSKYSPLSLINKENVSNLEVSWRWRSPDNELTTFQNSVFEATPLMIDGVLYTSTSFSQVAAIDAENGETLWVFDPQSYNYGRPPNNGFLHRGVSYFESEKGKSIYIATGDARLIALDAVSGKPRLDFGSLGNGTVDLLDGVPRLNADTTRLDNVHDQPDVPDMAGVVSQLGNSSPATICNDVLIVGTQVHDGEVLPPSPPGDVKGFDLNSGELLWTFHTVPREGELGVETWEDESWKTNGNTNVWAPMSADEELGMVYLPVSCPTNNYYGGRRHGDNLFANSVVALDCATGIRQWHFQTVHHDIWDYDLPAAPNLIDIRVDDSNIKALAQVSKQGFVYVFNRETGEPVWPIIETAVPASTVPGEKAAPTQPIPTKPPPFVRQGSLREDLADPASAENYDVGPLYTPPNTKGLIVTPGEGGGANWGGASYDPTSQMLYVAGFGPLTHLVKLVNGGQEDFYYVFPDLFFGPNTGSPYSDGKGSTITAYDMNLGEIKWQVAGAADETVIGNSASMVSGELLYYKNSSLQTLNVFDKVNGSLLRSIPLGGRPTGVPMTYEINGKQMVVIALGRQDEVMELVGLSLKE